jgi:hypothetical protein
VEHIPVQPCVEQRRSHLFERFTTCGNSGPSDDLSRSLQSSSSLPFLVIDDSPCAQRRIFCDRSTLHMHTPVPEPVRCKVFTYFLTSPAFPSKLFWGLQHVKGRCASPGRICHARGDLFVRLEVHRFLVGIVPFCIMPGAAAMAQVEAAPRSSRDERFATRSRRIHATETQVQPVFDRSTGLASPPLYRVLVNPPTVRGACLAVTPIA